MQGVLITYGSKILGANTKIQKIPRQDLERPFSKNMRSSISTTPNLFEPPPNKTFHDTKKIHDSKLDLSRIDPNIKHSLNTLFTIRLNNHS